MCLCQEEADGDGGGEALISACGCSGTIGWCHMRCLQQWRATLWAQGLFSRAARCEICISPYKLPIGDENTWALLDTANGAGMPPLWQLVQHRAMQLYHSPAAAFRAWRCCILIGGLACGTRRGMAGLGAGMNAGVTAARPLARLTLRLMPQLSVAAAMLPALAPALRQALRCSCTLMAAQVVGGAAAGLFGGGVVGFCLGTVGVLRLSADASYSAAALAARVAAALSRAAWPRASLLVLLRTVRLPHFLALLMRRTAAAAAAGA